MERRPTAILYADIYGYSRFTDEDEEPTRLTSSVYRRIIDNLIEESRDHFVNLASDSVLAE